MRSAVLVALLLASPTVAARPARFDEDTVQTVSGHVARSETRQGVVGVRVRLRERGHLDVQLAPGGFLARAGLRLRDGDRIIVTGSRLRLGGRDLMLAAIVTVRDRTVELRDRNGAPLWAPPPRAGGGPRRAAPPRSPSPRPRAAQTRLEAVSSASSRRLSTCASASPVVSTAT